MNEIIYIKHIFQNHEKRLEDGFEESDDLQNNIKLQSDMIRFASLKLWQKLRNNFEEDGIEQSGGMNLDSILIAQRSYESV